MSVKLCSKCGIEKDVSEFGAHSKMKDKLQIWCKSCVKDYSKKYSSSVITAPDTLKTCTKCNMEKSIVDFAKDKYKKDGYSVLCKKCNRDKIALFQEANKKRKNIPFVATQICSKCKIEKNRDEFRLDLATKNGLRNYCNSCISSLNKEYNKENSISMAIKKKIYRTNHPEKIKQYSKKYYKEHLEILKIKKIAYIKANKEKVSAARKLYRINNLSAIKEYQKIYNKENKEAITKQRKLRYPEYYKEHREEIIEKVTNYTINRCKVDIEYRNNIEAAWYVSRVLKPQILKRDSYKCQLCGCLDTTDNRLECHHILPKNVDPDKVFDVENLVTLCRSCHLYKAHNGFSKKYDEVLAEELLLQVKSRN